MAILASPGHCAVETHDLVALVRFLLLPKEAISELLWIRMWTFLRVRGDTVLPYCTSELYLLHQMFSLPCGFLEQFADLTAIGGQHLPEKPHGPDTFLLSGFQ